MSNVVALREPDIETGHDAQGDLLPEVSLDMQRLLAVDGDHEIEIPGSKWGGILGDMIDQQVAAFMRMGHGAEAAQRLARAGILALAELIGGKNWYFPHGSALREELRNVEIWRRFSGNNAEALAREYRLTLRQVYRILVQQRRASLARRQGNLFDPPAAMPG